MVIILKETDTPLNTMAAPSETLNDGLVSTAETVTNGEQTAMDAAETLVDGDPSQRSTVTVLTFTNDNPNNTRILNADRQVIYEVKPDFTGKRTMTNFRRFNPPGSGEGEVFGVLEWHDTFSDKISFNGGEMVKKSNFFKKSGLISFVLRFKDDQGRKYTWKGLGSGLQLALHAEDSPNKLPIAQFQKTRYDHSTDPPTHFPAQLFLTPRAVEIQDLVVFGFCVLEKDRRINETSSQNRADISKMEGQTLVTSSTGRAHSEGVGGGTRR
ncbi:hypothetical protein FRC03_003757 [Tulasnella sp. 419]|nr:hypothetical protein FRC03_003757 [Tulasnella sp. 419]